mmetsp:Transcript_49655/g.146767  ORF Transcript_49655/g.146767 Transcript_49655/m.146767 type:complete len:503 (+) Transcript_49655:561-2069(+)
MRVRDLRGLDELADGLEGGLALVPRPRETVLHLLEADGLRGHVEHHAVPADDIHRLLHGDVLAGLGDHHAQLDLPDHLDALRDLDVPAARHAGAHGADEPLRRLVVLRLLLLEGRKVGELLPLVVADCAHHLLPLEERVDRQLDLAARHPLAGDQGVEEARDDRGRHTLGLAHAHHRAEEVVHLARPPRPEVAAAARRRADRRAKHLHSVLEPGVLVVDAHGAGEVDDLLHGAAPEVLQLGRIGHHVLRRHGTARGLHARRRADEAELLPDLRHRLLLEVALHGGALVEDGLDGLGLGGGRAGELAEGYVRRVGRPVSDHPRLLDGRDDVAAARQGPADAPGLHDLLDPVEALDAVLERQHEGVLSAPRPAHLQAALGLPGLAPEDDHVGLEDGLGRLQGAGVDERAELLGRHRAVSRDALDSDAELLQRRQRLVARHEAHFLPLLRQAGAEVPADAAASEDQPPQRGNLLCAIPRRRREFGHRVASLCAGGGVAAGLEPRT